jgi:hypothetical protein
MVASVFDFRPDKTRADTSPAFISTAGRIAEDVGCLLAVSFSVVCDEIATTGPAEPVWLAQVLL